MSTNSTDQLRFPGYNTRSMRQDKAIAILSLLRTASGSEEGQSFRSHASTRRISPSSPSAFATLPSRRRRILDRSSSRRNLFSFNLNDAWKPNGDDEDDNNNDDEKDDPLPNTSRVPQTFLKKAHERFLTSLAANEEADGESRRDGSKGDMRGGLSSNLPLASLINVEALLMASGQDVEIEKENLSDLIVNDILGANNRKSEGNDEQKTQDASVMNTKPSTSSSSLSNDPLSIIPSADEFSDWDRFMKSIQQTLPPPSFELPPTVASTDAILRDATQKVESFLSDAAISFSPENVQNLIRNASRTLAVDQSADTFRLTVEGLVGAAEALAAEQGLDVSEAAAQARATTKYTAEFLRDANGVLLSGYVEGGRLGGVKDDTNFAKQMNIPLEDDGKLTKPLFHRYKSAQTISNEDFHSVLNLGSHMAVLAGAIYQDAVEKTHEIGHAIVANGKSADVAWMVTDHIGYESDFKTSNGQEQGAPIIIRTITLRGYDATDEDVDREMLLNNICDASSVPFQNISDDEIQTDVGEGILVHGGLLKVAEGLYSDLVQYIDLAGPKHKIVMNGHSIGGSLSMLLLFLLARDRGADFVNERVARVFTYGAIPIARLKCEKEYDEGSCSVLEYLGLPKSLVFGYVQPWDPIIRFFSSIDALYPLVGDLGADGVTLYASGPPRTLRPITRAILESWQGWPSFRDKYRGGMDQEYTHIGMQHLLLPDPGRYLTDRLLSVNVAAYEVEEVVSISTDDLFDALKETFPLDVFQISFVPAALRSFIHHFYPAYAPPFAKYVEKETRRRQIGENTLTTIGEISSSNGAMKGDIQYNRRVDEEKIPETIP